MNNKNVTYRRMASTVVHCTLSIWAAPNRVSTSHRICRKIAGIPAKIQNGNQWIDDDFWFLLQTVNLPDSFLCQQSDCMLDRAVHCISPTLLVRLHTATSAIWQPALANKMLKICAHFAGGHGKCTTKTLATNIKRSTGIARPTCQGSTN